MSRATEPGQPDGDRRPHDHSLLRRTPGAGASDTDAPDRDPEDWPDANPSNECARALLGLSRLTATGFLDAKRANVAGGLIARADGILARERAREEARHRGPTSRGGHANHDAGGDGAGAATEQTITTAQVDRLLDLVLEHCPSELSVLEPLLDSEQSKRARDYFVRRRRAQAHTPDKESGT